MASAATRQRWRRAAWCVGLPVVAVLVLGACSSAKGGSPGSATPPARTTAPPSSSKAAVPAAKIVAAPAATGDLSPAQPIKVSVIGGRLTAVALVNPDGKSVSGSLTPAATSWQNSEALGYSKTYTLTARAVNSAGVASTYNAKYTTVTPSNLTMPYFQYTGGYALQNGATYGVGIVPVIRFDEAISDKRAAMAALSVTTTPTVKGAWYWSDDQTVHYRPQTYWPSGTKVTINANVYGKQVSPGLYGQADAQHLLHRSVPNTSQSPTTRTHSVAVYFNDKLQRVMPTSMGRGGYVTGKDNVQISLWTMPGTYTVIAHENPAIMSSASYGLPANSPHGYGPEKVYWATKISTDGIYLHELDDDDLGAGQHRRLARLPEPQHRQRDLVLQDSRRRRRRRGEEHRRAGHPAVAGRRLERAVEHLGGRRPQQLSGTLAALPRRRVISR